MVGTIIKADPGSFSVSVHPQSFELIQVPIIAWHILHKEDEVQCNAVTPSFDSPGKKHVILLPDDTVIDHATELLYDSIEQWMVDVYCPAVIVIDGKEINAILSLADVEFAQRAGMMDSEEGARIISMPAKGEMQQSIEFCPDKDATHIFEGHTTRDIDGKTVIVLKLSSKRPR